MRPFINIASCASFLLHMWAGCCLHHAHAAEGAFGPQHTQISVGDPTIVQTFRSESPADGPCSEEQCSEGQCVSLVAGKVELSKVTTDTLLILCTGDESNDFSATHSWELNTEGVTAPPVRLHLLNQVLLI